MAIPGIAPFGTTASAQAVQKITLTMGPLSVALLTYGAILQSVRLEGVGHDLTLGSARLADYEGPMHYHGALIGPVANRITGAMATLDGRTHHFDPNEAGRNTLHSGRHGTHARIWKLAELTETTASLTVDLPDGEGGFPGNRRLTARFSLHADATLRLDLTATTDAATWINLANHSYWNLDGSPSWAGHRLWMPAEHYLPVDADLLPTGEIRAVAGTEMDFRQERTIQPGAPAMDTNFCLAPQRRGLTPALRLTGSSGLTMEMATTEPGLQIYDGRQPRLPGSPAYEGLAIEAQFWPDAPHQPAFPDITLRPGALWQQRTEWRFSRA